MLRILALPLALSVAGAAVAAASDTPADFLREGFGAALAMDAACEQAFPGLAPVERAMWWADRRPGEPPSITHPEPDPEAVEEAAGRLRGLPAETRTLLCYALFDEHARDVLRRTRSRSTAAEPPTSVDLALLPYRTAALEACAEAAPALAPRWERWRAQARPGVDWTALVDAARRDPLHDTLRRAIAARTAAQPSGSLAGECPRIIDEIAR